MYTYVSRLLDRQINTLPILSLGALEEQCYFVSNFLGLSHTSDSFLQFQWMVTIVLSVCTWGFVVTRAGRDRDGGIS